MSPALLSPRVLVIGGMNLDILGVPANQFVSGDSLPGTVSQRPGGVARNIAQQLAQQGAVVELICPLGNDRVAELLKASCAQLGIGLRFAIQTDLPSPSYLAIHDSQGEMVAAINDMRAMDVLHGEALRQKLQGLQGFDACVLDANLSDEALIAIAQTLTTPLIADPVSAAKCGRLKAILPRLQAVKPNLMEAQALTGCVDMEAAAQALLALGVQQVFISLGKDGVYYADKSKQSHLPAGHVQTAQTTGAGDVMTAGLALAIAQGADTRQAALRGMEAAYRFLYLHSKNQK